MMIMELTNVVIVDLTWKEGILLTQQLQRTDVSAHEKWNLAHIYADTELWDEDFEKANKLIAGTKQFEEHIHSARELLDFLTIKEELAFTYEKLFVYASLRLDEDTRESSSQALVDKAKDLGTEVSSASAFFAPFLLSLDQEVLESYIQEEQGLEYFRKELYEEYKYKEHILSKEKEEVLSQLGIVTSVPKTVFGMINNADIRFGEVTKENGEKVTLTRGMYSKILESHNRDARKEAFEAYYKPYVALKNTIASTLGSAVKNNVLFSKMRNYKSPLHRSLFADNVPVSVYENLMEATKNNLGPLHQYMDLRKKTMGVEELRTYDLSVPLVEGIEMNVPYDEAYDIMLKGLAPLGEEYLEVLKQAKTAGWIDVHETEGKRSGAYNWGPYGTHPYVLLNHNSTFDSVFTLAHEMGHAMHAHLSDKHQPRNLAQYKIFVAEVASTVNEILLMNYYLNHTEDSNLKKYLLNHFIDEFRGTFYTQVMFAEFEKITHEKSMAGEALNTESFSEIYEGLFKTYNGPTVVLNPELKYGWSRIPHFYNSFYVYKYATGFASAISIAYRILQGDQETVASYLEFLKSGGSDYPLELLKKTGVDLLSPEPIQNALSMFSDLVQQLETELA